MSGKRIVETCEHGKTERHLVHGSHTLRCYCTQKCDGGRTLTEGQYVLIEKVDGRWPMWAWQAAQHPFSSGTEGAEVLERLLDALSDHTEGET